MEIQVKMEASDVACRGTFIQMGERETELATPYSYHKMKYAETNHCRRIRNIFYCYKYYTR